MMIQLRRYRNYLILLIMIPFVFMSCTRKEYALYLGTDNDKKLIQLFRLLDDVDEIDGQQLELHYTIMTRIITEYRAQGEIDKMNLFLTDYIDRHDHDPYIAFYLLNIAENYRDSGARAVAETYFRRILNNYPDLIIDSLSLHKIILEELAFHSEDHDERVRSFRELLSRFPADIDRGQIYYYMGKSYEELGLWDEAFAAYEDFLESPETEIAGDPNARIELTDLLRFHRSDKSWTNPDLDDLVSKIKIAIRYRRGSTLKRYKADKFFTMSWSQDETDLFTHTNLDIASFLNPSIRMMRDLDPMSNESEAFLRTWGWSYRIRTWYLYFKKIDYPADPEINGRWEWAGIYFGDTF